MATVAGFVPSGLINADEMTVHDLVELGRYPYTNWIGAMTESDLEAVEEAIGAMGLGGLSGLKMSALSDGEKQRAMIARTLAQKTPLVLLDEPSAYLDIQNKYEITSLLRGLCNRGHAAVFSTHDLDLAFQFADKLWLIDQQQIIEGAPEDLVINGKIKNLFSSGKVTFDRKTGDFRPVVDHHDFIFISQVGSVEGIYEWTVRALGRAGYEISPSSEGTDLNLDLKTENGKNIWNLRRENEILSFNSIYDLIHNLKQFRK
jgi:iron complex transport system ATP-binding protein